MVVEYNLAKLSVKVKSSKEWQTVLSDVRLELNWCIEIGEAVQNIKAIPRRHVTYDHLRVNVTAPTSGCSGKWGSRDFSLLVTYVHNWLCGAEYHSRGHKLCSHSVVSQHFMEPRGSLPRSQELSICTYPGPDQCSLQQSNLDLLLGLKLNGTHQLLAYADDVNLLG
jgi:hypothetical protein